MKYDDGPNARRHARAGRKVYYDRDSSVNVCTCPESKFRSAIETSKIHISKKKKKPIATQSKNIIQTLVVTGH